MRYLESPPSADELRALLAKLDGDHAALVRRDQTWRGLGLSDADVDDDDKIVALLVRHPRLMERPVLVKGAAAIIGRPTALVGPFIAS
ncbi:hypothetical protein BH20ACT4_BH20ACT4_09810 [soil metagenome]